MPGEDLERGALLGLVRVIRIADGGRWIAAEHQAEHVWLGECEVRVSVPDRDGRRARAGRHIAEPGQRGDRDDEPDPARIRRMPVPGTIP